MTPLPAQVSAKVAASMRQVADAARRLAEQMPAVVKSMTAFVDTLRHLPDDAVPADDGCLPYDVLLWQDLLWYGYVKKFGATATGYTAEDVLTDLRWQIARRKDLPGPQAVALRAVPVPG